jgi:hypothetical protein
MGEIQVLGCRAAGSGLRVGQDVASALAGKSQQMRNKIRTQDGPVWYLVAKDEGHGFAKKSNRDFLQYALSRWNRGKQTRSCLVSKITTDN